MKDGVDVVAVPSRVVPHLPSASFRTVNPAADLPQGAGTPSVTQLVSTPPPNTLDARFLLAHAMLPFATPGTAVANHAPSLTSAYTSLLVSIIAPRRYPPTGPSAAAGLFFFVLWLARPTPLLHLLTPTSQLHSFESLHQRLGPSSSESGCMGSCYSKWSSYVCLVSSHY